LDTLGGIVTKAVSREPRPGHPAPRVAEFAGGMLNAVGLANPGVERVVNEDLPWLRDRLRNARVIVNVVGSTVADYAAVVGRLADQAIVSALELNVSCPNTARGGEEFGADDGVLSELVQACRPVTAKPLIAKLAPTLSNIARTAQVAVRAGADGISVVNTIPGTLYRWSGAGAAAPRLGYGQGGVSGPALLAIGVLAVRRVAEGVDCPVIGVGGVRRPEDVEQYLAAGAVLVGVGTAALADPGVPERLVAAWGHRRG